MTATEHEPQYHKVLLVGAHPDDPEFGCAATLAKWAKAGLDVEYLLLTSGDKGSHDPSLRPGQVAAIREREQRAAASALGVKAVHFLRYADGMLENTMEARARVCAMIRQIKPDILVAIDPWRPYQLHPDHRAAGWLALDGAWAAREWYLFPEQLVDDEPWRVSEVYLYWTDSPDHWEDVTDTIEQRIAAICCHESQVGNRRERVGEMIRQRTRETGEPQGMAYAEAFKRFRL